MQTETRRIVVVDDDELFRESLGANLMDEGFEVIDFAEGRAVIDFFAAKKDADIVLLDWKMPGMDGLEVLRHLRRAGIGSWQAVRKISAPMYAASLAGCRE